MDERTARILDGANARRSTTTSSAGSYSFTGLSTSGMTVNVTATNYNALSKGVTLTSSQSLDFQLAPTPVFTVAGVGNTVIDIPDTVLRLQVTGTYSASSSNFIPWLGPHNVACGSVISSGCHLLVNELLGAFYGQTSYTATVLTGAGGTTGLNSISITNSSGVAWTFTEVR